MFGTRPFNKTLFIIWIVCALGLAIFIYRQEIRRSREMESRTATNLTQTRINSIDTPPTRPRRDKRQKSALARSTSELRQRPADHTLTSKTVVMYPFDIMGVAYDKETSETLESVVVMAMNDSRTSAITDSNGHYRLQGEHDKRELRLKPAKDGYAIVIVNSPRFAFMDIGGNPDEINLDLTTATETIRRNIAMVQCVMHTGQVENEKGDPVPNARVRWFTPMNSDDDVPETLTDADGRFVIPMRPLEKGGLVATAEGYGLSKTSHMVQAGTTSTTIVLEPEAIIYGRVTNENGEGVTGVRFETGENFNFTIPIAFTRKWGESGNDGRFTFHGMPEGKYDLFYSADGYVSGRKSVFVRSGETTGSLEIMLKKASGLTIAGHVLDSHLRPFPASISIPGHPDIPYTDAKGFFEMTDVSEGTQTLTIFHREVYLTTETKVQAGDRNVRVVMPNEFVTVHGRVVDAVSNQSVTDFDIVDSPMIKIGRHGEPDNGFRFSASISENREGAARIRITAQGYATKDFKINITTGTKELTEIFEMDSGGIVQGRIVSQDKKLPIAGVAVGASFETNNSGGTIRRIEEATYSDSDGRFVLFRVPSGKTMIEAIPSRPLATGVRTVTIKDGETTDVGDVELVSMGSLRGRVIDKQLNSVAEATMLLMLTDSDTGIPYEMRTLQTDDLGHFDAGEITPGSYKLVYSEMMTSTDLEPGEAKDVLITAGDNTLKGLITVAGNPVEYGRIVFSSPDGSMTYTAQVRRGEYIQTGVATGEYQVVISGRSSDHTIREILNETVTVPDQDEIVKDFVIP